MPNRARTINRTEVAVFSILLLLSTWSVADTTRPSQEPVPPEAIVARLKPGTLSRDARKIVEDSRIGDKYYWEDSFWTGLDRFQLDRNAYLLLKYKYLKGSLNTSPQDPLLGTEITRFTDLKPAIPENLFSNVEQISESPLPGIHFQPVYLIRCVNCLRKSGKQTALASLRKYVELADWSPEREEQIYRYGLDATRVCLIARLLFVPQNGKKMLAPMTVMIATSPATQSIKSQYPLFPLVLQNGIPFDISNGSYGGDTNTPAQDLNYCEANCDLRSDDLVPNSSPLKAAESMLRSADWMREIAGKYADEDVKATESLIRIQALRAVSLQLAQQCVAKDSIDEISDTIWKSTLANRDIVDLQWDVSTQCFVAHSGKK